MAEKAKDEKNPFAEKYEARQILEDMLDQIQSEWEEQSDIIMVIKALIYCKLGSNYYDAEEISDSYRKHEQSYKIWKNLSLELRLRFT